MIEPHTTLTYDQAFARARAERSAAFRALFGFGRQSASRATTWNWLPRFA